MHYISTRGTAPKLNFEEVTLAGLAMDGGLYVPETWPQLDHDAIRALRGLSYPQLAEKILSHFCDKCISENDLSGLLTRAYSGFDHAAIAPLKQIDSEMYVMELFHGPTLAFKDFALQFLGHLFNYFLSKQNSNCTIVGATSGDTGSAAIEAVRGLNAVKLYMLHPEGRVSDVQRKQMTTVLDENIHNLAINGTFDDCQNLVKAMFNDKDFRNQHNLSAVNSINWARIAAQVVYYFRAALELGAPDRPVNFSVPTGNFGNVFAGYVAQQMGLPINKLIIGSNSNDILTRFFENGHMQQRGVNPTLSPSMDIQISSNFERFLFELFDRDASRVRDLMQDFSQHGEFQIDPSDLEKAQNIFSAHRLSDEDTKLELKRVFESSGEIMDPHSVIGVAAARVHSEAKVPTIVLGTAHPAKFGSAVKEAIGVDAKIPPHLAPLMSKPEKVEKLDNDLETVQAHISKTA